MSFSPCASPKELQSAPLGHLTELELNASALPGLGASPQAPLVGLPRLGFLETLRLVGPLDPSALDLLPCASLRSLGIFGESQNDCFIPMLAWQH